MNTLFLVMVNSHHNIVVLNENKIVNVTHLPPPLDTALNEGEISQLVPTKQSIETSELGHVPSIRSLASVERDAIEQAIELCKGNIPKAAALLDVSPSTLYRKKQGWESGSSQV